MNDEKKKVYMHKVFSPVPMLNNCKEIFKHRFDLTIDVHKEESHDSSFAERKEKI